MNRAGLIILSALAAYALWLGGCSDPPRTIERIQAVGELRVATRNNAVSYYIGPDGPAGFEYDLLRGFADELGVTLRFIVPPAHEALYPIVAERRADLAAAHLPVRYPIPDGISYGPTYLIMDRYVIYKRETRRPRKIDDLVGSDLHLRSGSYIEEFFETLRAEYPELSWTSRSDVTTDELVAMVAAGEIRFTAVQANTFLQAQRLHPEARIAFKIGDPVAIAWAFNAADDGSLRKAVTDYLQRLRDVGEFDRIWDRYFGHTQRFDYVDARTFLRHYEGRLPEYRPIFEAVAEAYEFDWRLLAALSYQESHWNPKARSPTGVRGLMMLTLTTARALKVDRNDPPQAIAGGAHYLARLHERLPARIPEPDRTWLALAAYNVGYAHLEDARVLTERQGYDPDRWIHVAVHLPLLRNPTWYKQTRHGFARGDEAVQYVRNIRRYYDVLVWIDGLGPLPSEQQLAARLVGTPVL